MKNKKYRSAVLRVDKDVFWFCTVKSDIRDIDKSELVEVFEMKCPLCGNEMEKGYVQSARRVLFTKEQNEGFFDIKAKDDIVLSSNNWTHPTCVAYHCRDCKKVIIDYSQTVQ